MIRSQFLRLRHHVLIAVNKVFFRPASEPACTSLGSRYGRWAVPLSVLSEESICYLVGVGEDITFDLALIESVGCEVWAFDPTPRAIRHVESHAAGIERFHFTPVGLWTTDATLQWYVPANPQHVSHSVVNLQGTSEFFEAPCLSLSSMMANNEHDHVDLLKIDIEGAEHAVLRDLVKTGPLPRVLAVEFDQPWAWSEVRTTINLLVGAGFRLVNTDGWNYTFVRDVPGDGDQPATR